MPDHKITQQLNRELANSVVVAMESWLKKYKDKNENYGASWLLTGQTLHLWFGTLVLDTPQKHIIYGLVTRMLDKIIRGVNLQLVGEPDKVGEAAAETFADLGVYGFMSSRATEVTKHFASAHPRQVSFQERCAQYAAPPISSKRFSRKFIQELTLEKLGDMSRSDIRRIANKLGLNSALCGGMTTAGIIDYIMENRGQRRSPEAATTDDKDRTGS
jgi:hypothetical protein